MIVQSEFIRLCSIDEPQFWAQMKGASPQQAAQNLKEFEQALTTYSARAGLQGKVDGVQLNALGLKSKLEGRLWVGWTYGIPGYCPARCQAQKVLNKDKERVTVCAKHGPRHKCMAEFKAWINANRY